VTLTNCTVANNAAPQGSTGAAIVNGIDNDEGFLTLNNTIVANSIGGSADVIQQGAYIDGHNNLIVTFSGPTQTLSGTIKGNLGLGDLKDNGGPTATMALSDNSDAISAGDPTRALGPDCKPLQTDQRGYARFHSDGSVDIGAYEVPYLVATLNVGWAELLLNSFLGGNGKQSKGHAS
jgi:hypothetical protein